MSGFPLKNILLPAIIVSSTTFASLTIPFAFLTSEPIVVEFPPFFSGEIQPIFSIERKDMAIRYIGFTIILSVGTGLGTAEFIRTRQAAHELTQTQKQVSTLQQSLQEKEAQVETFKTTEPERSSSALFVPDEAQEDLETASSILQTNHYFETEAIQDFEVDLFPEMGSFEEYSFNPASIQPHDSELGLSLLPYDSNGTQARVLTDDLPPLQRLDSNDGAIAPSYQQFQTYRVSAPHLQRHLFAILYEGKYYSLFRTRKDEKKALNTVTTLDRRGKKAVVTQSERGYIVWMQQPDAEPDLIS